MKKKLIYIFIAVLLILSVLFIFRGVILENMAQHLIVRDKLQKVDCLVVLSGDVNGERVAQAVKLYKSGWADKILMTGGPLAWKLSSAEWMKKQAISSGVPVERILIEGKARSTYENAKESLRLLKDLKVDSIILVTSPTHSRRALSVYNKIFGKENIVVFSYPVVESEFVLSKWWTRHEDTQKVIWEYVSLVYYFLKGYN